MPTAQTDIAALDIARVRSQFPSLSQTVAGQPAVFLDGPGGTQVPQRVIDAISDYLKNSNANTHGAYATSRRTDAVVAEARAAMADFFGCDSDEVVFGPNMTTLTFAISRSIGRELGPGDEILLTHLDHDANVSPWRALEERGVTIRFADINFGGQGRRLHPQHGRPGAKDQQPDPGGGGRLCLECGGHDQRRERNCPAGASEGRARLHRRRALRAPRPD